MFKVARKIGVGRETGNTHIFLFGLSAHKRWKNDVSSFTQSPSIGSFSNLQIMRSGQGYRNFEIQIGPLDR